MGVLIYSLKLFKRSMRVDLRSGDTRMPEQPSYTFYAGAMIKHGGRESMPKHMR